MTSCGPPPRMRWSGATGAIARGKRVSTACGRKRSSVRVLHWIGGVKRKPKVVNKPLHYCIVHELDKPGSSATVSEFCGNIVTSIGWQGLYYMVGQLNELSTALVLQFALILNGVLQEMDAIVDIHFRHELQFSLLGPHDHRATVIPKVFGRPLIASRLRNRILASRAIDQRNLRQQIIFIQIELFDVDFGAISPYKGVGVDLLFTHIIFFKIALIYILIIVGIPAATAATAIAIAIHLAVARAMIGRQTQIRLTPAFGRRIE